MKYYVIAGEASGDLHASHLMRALKERDTEAQFRCVGGDMMQAEGATLVRHYSDLAYMGIIPVLMHLRTILSGMSQTRQDIVDWKPDVLILVDYPGFNLKIAKYIKKNTKIPVFYYIAPKLWAWKEYRIKNIRRDVDELFSILPFEVDFFEGKHHYPIHYVGNPTVDEVDAYVRQHPADWSAFCQDNNLPDKPIIALLAGSRKQEIKDNLPKMLKAVKSLDGYQFVLAGAPSISLDYYQPFMESSEVKILFGKTYEILQYAEAALVTSGTATLETALFRVPQVVCYETPLKKIIGYLRKKVLKVKYISLVNLIADKEVVAELVADSMTVSNIRTHLEGIIEGGANRTAMLAEYDRMLQILGPAGASEKAADEMIRCLKQH